jgi:hypothetical protein
VAVNHQEFHRLDAEIMALLYGPDGSSRVNSDTTLSILLAATARAVCGVADAMTRTPGEASAAAQGLARQFGENLRASVADGYEQLATLNRN